MQHCGFARMPTTSCGKWFDIQPFVIRAKSAPKFPGVCYDGAAGDGVLCRFQKIMPVWCFFFSGFWKDSIKYFFHPLPRETPLGDTNIMQTWWGKGNVWLEIWCNSYAYFLCHCGVSIPQIFQGSMMVSFRFTQFTKTSLPRACPDTLGLWKKDRTKVWAKFVEPVGRVWQGHLDFHEIHWFILEGWPPFFLGVQTSLFWLKSLCEMMLEDDGFFFGGTSGNSCELMKQHH